MAVLGCYITEGFYTLTGRQLLEVTTPVAIRSSTSVAGSPPNWCHLLRGEAARTTVLGQSLPSQVDPTWHEPIAS
jgi:hypothetical protein